MPGHETKVAAPARHSARPASLSPADDGLLERLVEPGVCDVRDRLLAHGASTSLTASVVRAVLKRGAKGAWAIDAAAAVLGRAFATFPSPKLRRGSGRVHTFAFVGPTGAGKTSTLAKLSRKLAEAGRSVLNASFDAAGASGLARVGGLETDVDRTEIPLVAIRDGLDLAAAMHRARATEICLVDTPGASPRDDEELDALANDLHALSDFGPVDVLLVLPATASRGSLRLARRAFARTGPTAGVVTKLDETEEPVAVLEEVGRSRLPIAFLCDGVDVRDHLARPTASRFADLCLRGRYR